MSGPTRRKLSAQEVKALGLDTAPHETETEVGPSQAGNRPSDYSPAESALMGAGQGASLHFGDELYGAVGALGGNDPSARGYSYSEQSPQTITKTRITPRGSRVELERKTTVPEKLGDDPARSLDFLERLREKRETARQQDRDASSANPTAYGGAEFAGALLPQAAATALAGPAALTPAGQAVLGGAQGLGDSDADLTTGDAKEFAKAAGRTAVSAAAAGVLTKGAQVAGDKIANSGAAKWLDGKIAGVKDDAAAQATKAIDKKLASLKGAFGAESQVGSRQLENLGREAAATSPELSQAASQALESDSAKALRESVVRNTTEAVPGQASRIAAAKEAFESASKSREADIAAKAEDLLADPIGKQIVPRLKTYASRAIPLAVGTAIGGIPGAAAGLATAAALGAPGTAIANAARSPAIRKLALETMQKVLIKAPQRLGKYAPALLNAGSPVLMHKALEESDPNYLDTLLGLAHEDNTAE